MNYNSKICCFINEHKDWKKFLIDDYHIKIKEDYPFSIFNYDIGCDFSNPIVQEARGIIINLETLDVVCWPFRKFGNYNESYVDKIDWNTARVQDKIDGSLVKLWYNNYCKQWQFSSNSVINAYEAIANITTGISFGELIEKSIDYNIVCRLICDNILDKNCTYMFELTSPYNQIVVKYGNVCLTHIGTRNNITGEEILPSGKYIRKPKEYVLKSLNDCINAAIELNKSEDGFVSNVSHEGFVVVDDNWNRIKIKSPDYLMLHHMSSNSNFSKERIINMLRNDLIDISNISDQFPEFAHYFKYYDYKITELEYQAKVFCDLTDRLNEEYSYERKAVANVIKKHKLASIAFQHLDSGESSKNILNNMPLNRYVKLIPDYKPEKFSDLFMRGKNEETNSQMCIRNK